MNQETRKSVESVSKAVRANSRQTEDAYTISASLASILMRDPSVSTEKCRQAQQAERKMRDALTLVRDAEEILSTLQQ